MSTPRHFDRLHAFVLIPSDHGPCRRDSTRRPRRRVSAKAFLNVYRGADGLWHVRRADATPEGAFKERLRAVEFARLLGMAAGSYRIRFETAAGDIVEERFASR